MSKIIGELEVCPDAASIGRVLAFIEDTLGSHEVPVKVCMTMSVVADEVYANIVNYSRADNAKVVCKADEASVTLEFSDNGIPFDPTLKAEVDISVKVEDRAIGGLGIHMVKKMTDSMLYEYKDERNILKVTKNYS